MRFRYSARRTRFCGVRILALAAAATCVLLGACHDRAQITIAPGSSRDSLIFQLSSGDGGGGGESPDTTTALPTIVSFTVDRPGRGRARNAPGMVNDMQWQIVATDAGRGAPAPRVIRYGYPPAGFTETRPHAILGPGTYAAIVMGRGVRGHLQFAVTADGRIE